MLLITAIDSVCTLMVHELTLDLQKIGFQIRILIQTQDLDRNLVPEGWLDNFWQMILHCKQLLGLSICHQILMEIQSSSFHNHQIDLKNKIIIIIIIIKLFMQM